MYRLSESLNSRLDCTSQDPSSYPLFTKLTKFIRTKNIFQLYRKVCIFCFKDHRWDDFSKIPSKYSIRKIGQYFPEEDLGSSKEICLRIISRDEIQTIECKESDLEMNISFLLRQELVWRSDKNGSF